MRTAKSKIGSDINWQIWKRLEIYVITAVFAAIVLIRLGLNTGAWLSYYLQLLMPSIIITSFALLALLFEKYNIFSPVKILMEILILIIVIQGYLHIGQVENNSKEDIEKWQMAYDIVDSYSGDCESMYLSPVLGYYAYESGYLVYDNGHDYTRLILEKKYKAENGVLERIFPMLGQVYNLAHDQKEKITNKIQNKGFTLIATDGSMSEEYYALVKENYSELVTLDLHVGEQMVYITFWIPSY